MDTDPDYEAIIAWFNRHNGFTQGFDNKTRQELEIIEDIAAADWCAALRSMETAPVGCPVPNPNDPPDVHVEIDGIRRGIEIVRLVRGDLVKRAGAGESPYCEQFFHDAQWTEDVFQDELTRVVTNKAERYEQRGVVVDALVIVSIEPYLTSRLTEAWSPRLNMRRFDALRSVCLMLPYESGSPKGRRPIQWVYGRIHLFPS